MGLLSHKISVHKSQESIPLNPREERKKELRGDQERDGRRQAERGDGVCCVQAQKKEREGERVFNPLTLDQTTPRLN